jgi:hypothetical protein
MKISTTNKILLGMLAVLAAGCTKLTPVIGPKAGNGLVPEAKRERVVVHVKEDPDPSVLGKDVDKNGVHDDTQAWIENQFKDSVELKKAALNFAAADQKQLAEDHSLFPFLCVHCIKSLF